MYDAYEKRDLRAMEHAAKGFESVKGKWTPPFLTRWMGMYKDSGDSSGAEAVWNRFKTCQVTPSVTSYRTLIEVHTAAAGRCAEGGPSTFHLQKIEELWSQSQATSNSSKKKQKKKKEKVIFSAKDFSKLIQQARACKMQRQEVVWAQRAKDAGVGERLSGGLRYCDA